MADHRPIIEAAPIIDPVPAGAPRPRWSVMIPTFNCAAYLRETLRSVLAQDPGPAAMQIEVVDDCSTNDDPAAVVRELSPDGRVHFHRQPVNGGAIRNFNTCVARSRGELVHLLHGDDLVDPGFYAAIDHAAQAHPGIALFATLSYLVDSHGRVLGLTPFLPPLAQPTNDVRPFFPAGNPLQTPSVVLRRSFYEGHGGFLPQLVHTADWEMWVRAVSLGRGLLLPQVLARYRLSAQNDTSRLRRSGENLHDHSRLADVFAARYPAFSRPLWHDYFLHLAGTQVLDFTRAGDLEAAAAATRARRQGLPAAFWRRYYLRRLAIRLLNPLCRPFGLELGIRRT